MQGKRKQTRSLVCPQLFRRQHRLHHASGGIQGNACVAAGISGLWLLGKQELQEDAKEKNLLFKGIYRLVQRPEGMSKLVCREPSRHVLSQCSTS